MNDTTQQQRYSTALPSYFTAKEASDYLGLDKTGSYISSLIREGKIFAYKVGSTWLIPENVVYNQLTNMIKKKK